MLTVQEIIEKWPSAAELSRDLGLRHESHATVMKYRGSIPSTYWMRMIEAAKDRKIEGISLEVLAEAHAPQSATEQVRA